MPTFAPATRKKLKLRMAVDGPSGSGKTYTALRFAHALGKRIVAIDTEHGSMSKYRGESPDDIPWQWKVCELQHFDPANYTTAIQEAAKLKPDVLIIDSLSHGWEGIGGALEQVEKSSSKNKYTAWKEVTPKHRAMIEAILAFPAHVIVTMRSKMEHVLEENEKGKLVPRKVGMAPIQRPGTEYEFDIVGELDWNHTLTITKTRCPAMDGIKTERPGPEFMQPVLAWLDDGEALSKPAGEATLDVQHEATPPSAISPTEQAVEEMIEAIGNPNANGIPVEPDETGHAARDSDPCHSGQQETIKQLAKGLEWQPTTLKAAILNDYGKDRLAKLSMLEADKLIMSLRDGQLVADMEEKTNSDITQDNDIPF